MAHAQIPPMPDSPMRERVLDLIRSRPSQPLTKSDLARHLQVPSGQRAELRAALASLLEEGLLQQGRKACYLLPKDGGNTLTGTIKFHPKGHATFFPDAIHDDDAVPGMQPATRPRLHIPRRDAGTALDGDRVVVALQAAPGPRRGARQRAEFSPAPDEPRGKVEKVLERRSNRVVGVFRRHRGFAWIESDDKAIDRNIDLSGDTSAQPGQMVVVDLDPASNPRHNPRGRIIEVLGWPGDAGVDIAAVIHRFGLPTSFPEPVLAAARHVSEDPDAAELRRRHDWRNQLVITIDPADAKDHDDAIWVEKTSTGWTLAVHIADVSHYIKPGSPMDREAALRGNSTYLVDRVLPMLPVELSNGICSLKPHVDRLTKCAVMEVNPRGEITRTRFIDAVIHSRAKLSYEQAQAILDGNPPPPDAHPQLAAMVREAWNLASVLRRRRFHKGALDLDMPEIRVVLDDHGRAIDANPVIHTPSHQLIEECMLAANDAVARILRERMKPSLYRIHEDPDPSKLLQYAETAVLHGYRPGDLTNRAHIQKLLDEAKGSPEEHIIKLGLLKSLKRAAYSADPVGHYGLAKGDYCHFTSPIRRYADLIVHRALQPLLENPPAKPDRTPSQHELRELSRHISDTERTSAEAETETKQIKLFEYLERLAELHDPHVFDGLVTDVRGMGLMVEIPEMALRGVVKREDLPHGRWRLETHRLAWVSADGMVIQPGMRVPLHVVAIDRDQRFVDFMLAGPPAAVAHRPGGARLQAPAPATKHRGKPQPKPAATAGPPPKHQRHRKSNRARRR